MATTDDPSLANAGPTAPAFQSDPVDLSTTDATLTPPTRALYVGTGGTVVGRLVNDTSDRTWLNVANGTILPGCFIKVTRATTTASNILALR